MADVRALLRQQKAARRIDHPLAAYSDGGKLLCTLCHEPLKSESLWEPHLRSTSHRQKLQSATKSPAGNGHVEEDSAPSNKRRHDSDEDEDEDMNEPVRKKRSTAEMNTPARLANGTDLADKDLKERTLTPPSLTRRPSQTPGQGLEMQIPSRPATPAHRDGTSSTPTPVLLPGGPSPIIPQEPTTLAPTALTHVSENRVDEDEWAAFEADIAAVTAPHAEDAVISAPAMTAEEHANALQAEEEERQKRRAAADAALADEKEEATRALETEFEDMAELEARVRRLKEKREALRQPQDSGVGSKPVSDAGKENTAAIEDNTLEDEDDSEEEDDWVGFRYRA